MLVVYYLLSDETVVVVILIDDKFSIKIVKSFYKFIAVAANFKGKGNNALSN